MIPVTNLRTGTVFKEGGQPVQVLSYEHQKLGRGSANIKVKIKNLKTKSVTEKTFISGAKVEEAEIEWKEAQYLYQVKSFVFMDPKNFEQFELAEDKIGDEAGFLKEGMTVRISFYEGKPLSLELPLKMEFTVAETGPDIRGDSATNIWKTATLENGLEIKVPLFVKVGDRIEVDTRTKGYLGRTK